MNLIKTTINEDFVLAIKKDEPERFVLIIDGDEIKLVGLALEEFGGRRIYDATLREDARLLSSIMWKRQEQMRVAEQFEQDRENEQKGEDQGQDDTPDWKKT